MIRLYSRPLCQSFLLQAGTLTLSPEPNPNPKHAPNPNPNNVSGEGLEASGPVGGVPQAPLPMEIVGALEADLSSLEVLTLTLTPTLNLTTTLTLTLNPDSDCRSARDAKKGF